MNDSNNIYFAFKLHFIVLQGHSFDVSNLDNKLDFPFARISNKKRKMCSFSSNIRPRIIQLTQHAQFSSKKCTQGKSRL